uniref:Exocyst complex component Sec8 n=1 Tax=Meloidogyne incognita TaxID=6306 RepID=A0A914NN86_MELIC
MELYALRFASFWILILEHFIKAVSEKYSQITMLRQPQGDVLVEYPKLSAAWVVDEDIARLLKSLPSWTAILAYLHESLQWFIGRIKELLSGLSPKAKELTKTRIQISTADGVLLEQMLCDAINDRIGTLEKLSDSILLVLHLELRFHCFFHLLPITINQNSSTIFTQQEEMDKDVMEFGRDLTQLHSILQSNLSGWKLKYMFDGLGYLCSSIFIHSCHSVNKLSEIEHKRICRAIFTVQKYLSQLSGHSVNKLSEIEHKRICRAIFTVQKYLSQLSGRPETDMQRAQMFFEFLNRDLDQLFSTIIERGATFSFVEYSILLALMIRSHPQLHSQPGALETATKQLREILTQRSNQQEK